MDRTKSFLWVDRFVIILGLIYVFLPVYIFIVGWLNIYVAFLSIAILSVCFWKLASNICWKAWGGKNQTSFQIKYWLVVGGVILFWVYISGIGGFSYQTWDFFVRNPIFRDLCKESWPVRYDLSQQPGLVQDITGTSEVAFTYYFSFWLPAALFSKIFGLSEVGSNIALYGWACLGILLVVYLLNRYQGRNSYVTLWLLVCFSGLDVIGFFIKNGYVPTNSHMEWWASYFQYSANTTQLFWVFNQSIPVWVICAMMLQFGPVRKAVGLSAMVFAYSPWAAMGMVPLSLSVLHVKGESPKEKVRGIFTFENMVLPLFMLLIYGTFYLANSSSVSGTGFLFALNRGRESKVILHMLLFWILEFGIYFFIMGNTQVESPFYWVVLAELLCFPLYHISAANDFVMRASMPALFFTMVYVGRFMELESSQYIFRKKIMVAVLCVGMWTSITEINRNISNTLNNEVYINDPVHSLGMIATSDEEQIRTIMNQFFVYEYEEKFFFQWLSKK